MSDQASDILLRLQAVIDTAIDGIITINKKGIVDSINPAAARLFGYQRSEVIGNNISMLMPSPHQQKHDGYLANYHQTGQAQIIGIGREVKGLRKDGSVFPFRLAVSEIRLKGQRIYTGIIHDLTDIKKAEERMRLLNEELEHKVRDRTNELAESVNKLLSTNQRLQHEVKERKAAELALRKSLDKEKELNELKSRFVSMASHEFRTPLSSILSSAELVAEYKLAEQQAKREKHINRIKSSIRNLTTILNDFLSLSKLEEGAIRMQPQELSLVSFCKEVFDEMRGMLKPGQKIIHELDDREVELFLDPNFLKNILFNLMSNASKYSAAEKPIYCRMTTGGDQLRIEIEDQGIGIPLEDQQHLFSRFFRAHNAENIKGTGLGLRIVKRYIDLMGGTIRFDSQEGRGSTFIITLPKRVTS